MLIGDFDEVGILAKKVDSFGAEPSDLDCLFLEFFGIPVVDSDDGFIVLLSLTVAIADVDSDVLLYL